MKIIDSHVHVLSPHPQSRPSHGTARTVHGWSEFGVERVVAEMTAAGVDRAVLIPSGSEGDANDPVVEAVADYPDRLVAVGRIDLRDPSNSSRLVGWQDYSGLRGIRVTFRQRGSDKWLDDGTADWFWPVAEEAGVPVFVHAPGLLDRVARIAQTFSSLRLAIDHCGLSPVVREHEIDQQLDAVAGLAVYPNVSVKLSALPSVAGDRYPYPSMHRRIARVLDAFGAHRAFWGTDLTRLPCTYRQAVEMFTQHLSCLDGRDLEWVMGRGIEQWLGMGAGGPDL